MTGKVEVDWRQFFQLAPTGHGLRGHSMKLFVPTSRTAVRKNFFSRRVIGDWNRLPQSVVEATTVKAFKSKLDKYWEDMSN